MSLFLSLFFCDANLCYIIDQAATLPTMKFNPLLGETKGQFILNIPDVIKGTKDCKCFSEELSLDFGEWSEAAQNCFCFHQMQDRDGDLGPYATWWSSHFNFSMCRRIKSANIMPGRNLNSNCTANIVPNP